MSPEAGDPLDTHEPLIRARDAGILEMIWRTSCAVRDRALAISQEHEEQELERKTQAAAARSVVTSIELRNADQTIAQLAISAARKVHRDGRCTKKDIVNGCFKKPEQAAIPPGHRIRRGATVGRARRSQAG